MTIDEDLNFVQPVLVFFEIKILLKHLNCFKFWPIYRNVSAEEWLEESYETNLSGNVD